MATLAELLKTKHAELSAQASKAVAEKEKLDKALTVKTDRSGRAGKTVTLISGFDHNPQVIEKLAREIKQGCGTGGTVKGKVIEIQGDQVKKVKEVLISKGYAVRG
ncbi:MAG: translation initiation factor [Bacteroidetes bacterium]|nr:translation initiation factor [Bacteroidota bacterium]